MKLSDSTRRLYKGKALYYCYNDPFIRDHSVDYSKCFNRKQRWMKYMISDIAIGDFVL